MASIVMDETLSSKPNWIYKLITKPDSEEEEWRAFRITDQKKIETCLKQGEEEVLVRGGRYIVNVNKMIVNARYWQEEPLIVRKCGWCWKEGNGSFFKPVCPLDEETQIETAYQDFKAKKQETTKTFSIPSSISVTFSRNGNGIIVVTAKKATGLASFLPFQAPLTRGWGGDIEIADPVDELPTNHLVLVVHGIGESLFSKETSPLPPFKECINTMRTIARTLSLNKSMAQQQQQQKASDDDDNDDDMNNKASDENETEKETTTIYKPTKTEILPIEWHQACRIKKDQLIPATLSSVPKVREFANEALLDAMLLLTPKWRKIILETTVEKITTTVKLFQKDNPKWNCENITLVGHSLGSVIMFEILSHPNLPLSQMLTFYPKNYLALGSPIAVFGNTMEENPSWLSDRVSNMRINENFRNVFHPNDPVAYQLEPLLLPCNHFQNHQLLPHENNKLNRKVNYHPQNDLNSSSSSSTTTISSSVYPLSPIYMDTVSGDDFLNVKLKKATKSLKSKTKKVEQVSKNLFSNALNFVENIGKSEEELVQNKEKTLNETSQRTFCQKCYDLKIPQHSIQITNDHIDNDNDDDSRVDKSLFRKHRIDFMLQISDLEMSLSEYISALKAHTCYYEHPDVVLFIQNMIDAQDKESSKSLKLSS